MDDEIIRERVNFLKVPVDIVAPDQLARLIYQLLEEKKEQNIVLLSVWDLLRARRNAEYRAYVKQATLVIPISKSIIRGIRFLLGKQAVRYMPFDFVIKLLAILEGYEFTTYLLGGKKRVLMKVEKNIRETFPGLRVVGRYHGSFRRQDEATIIEAIPRNSVSLGKGMRLWCSDLFDVFAERKRHPSRAVFDLGLEWVGYCLQNPLKLLRIFPFMFYNFLLLIYKVFSRRSD